jgi:uncharacterized protein (DUF1800 family)
MAQHRSRLRTRRNPALHGFITGLLLAALTFTAPLVFAGQDKKGMKDKGDKNSQLSKAFRGKLPISELSEDEATLHALNRLAFGPRPGDVDRVRQMGLEKWVAAQLDPGSIDDKAVEARLGAYPTLKMSTEKLLSSYPRPNQQAKKEGLSKEEFQKQRRQKAESGEDDVRRPRDIIVQLSEAKLTRAIYSERQLQEVMADFWFNHFNIYAAKGADVWLLTSYERDVIRPHTLGKFRDLLYATAKSPAMLFYLDNWLSADPKAYEQHAGELQARRQRFMRLFGGDPRIQMRTPNPNRPDFPSPQNQPQQGQRQAAPKQPRGLNENYGRELMELHTLGVDGGYTQQDVTQAALALTGWTMRAPRRDPEFHFDERIHGGEPKTILGQTIHSGGMKDGEQLIDMLARHASTAKFISTKLARRFVTDNPPPELVERMARTFSDTDGNIREVMKTMIYSPEFWSRAAYRAKIKKPFELVVSAMRASGAEMEDARPLVQWTSRIGEPLYACQPPTGYSDKAETWVNSGALLNRLNFALALGSGKMRGTSVDSVKLLGAGNSADADDVLNRALKVFLGGQVSPETRATLEKQLNDPQVLQAMFDDPVKNVDAGMIAGLVLGAPEFQRR